MGGRHAAAPVHGVHGQVRRRSRPARDNQYLVSHISCAERTHRTANDGQLVLVYRQRIHVVRDGCMVIVSPVTARHPFRPRKPSRMVGRHRGQGLRRQRMQRGGVITNRVEEKEFPDAAVGDRRMCGIARISIGRHRCQQRRKSVQVGGDQRVVLRQQRIPFVRRQTVAGMFIRQSHTFPPPAPSPPPPPASLTRINFTLVSAMAINATPHVGEAAFTK